MSIYDKSSLVLIPSGTKTGKVFSQKPVSGDGDFTFTRASAATRVNADGNIEKETQNLLLQSNTFNTTWLSNNVTETSGQSGYDGSSDAWLLSKAAASGNLQQIRTLSDVQTLSIYAKAGTLSWIRILMTRSAGNSPSAFFNLSGSGSVGTSSGIGLIDATIESVGGDWYRCSLIVNIDLVNFRIYPADGDGDVSGTSGNIYIQDAQLEQGLVARDYIETTTAAVYGGITDNTPRLDYTDSSCPALLLEPQRSNLLSQSEYYATTPYSRVNASVTHNDLLSPEGVVNSAKLESNSSGSASRIETFPTLADNTIYTASIFAKQGDVDYIMVNLRDKNNDQHNTYFDLSDGTKGSSNGSPIDSSIEAVGDYYRVTLTINSSSGGTTPRLQYLIANTDNNVVTASGEYIHIYGAQLEAGSYATSYIPTYGSSVSRVADGCSKTGISSLIGQTEGTLFVEMSRVNKSIDWNFVACLYNGATGDFLEFLFTAADSLVGHWRAAGVYNSITATGPYSGKVKMALAYKSGEYAFYVNGVLIGTNTASGVPVCDHFDVGWTTRLSGYQVSDPIHQSLLFKTRLSNEELAALTTI